MVEQMKLAICESQEWKGLGDGSIIHVETEVTKIDIRKVEEETESAYAKNFR